MLNQRMSAVMSFCFACLVSFFTTSMTVHAEEQGKVADFIEKSRVVLDVTYASKYLGRRGVDYFGNGAAIHPTAQLFLADTGLYLGISGATPFEDKCTDPFGGKCADWVEYDYFIGHSKTFLEETPLKTTYLASYMYISFPKVFRQDLQQLELKFTHTDLLPKLGPSKPSLYWGLYYTWRAQGRGLDIREFLLGLSYDLPVASKTVNLFVDGIWDSGPGGFVKEKGLTRIRTGASTNFAWEGFNFRPEIYYQSKMKRTNPESWLESEFWVRFSVSYAF